MIYLTDAEIAKALGVSQQEWNIAAVVLEKNGLPRRDALFSNKRCWPAVEAFLIRRATGPCQTSEALQKGQYNGFKSKTPTRTKETDERHRQDAVVLDLLKARDGARLSTNGSPDP